MEESPKEWYARATNQHHRFKHPKNVHFIAYSMFLQRSRMLAHQKSILFHQQQKRNDSFNFDFDAENSCVDCSIKEVRCLSRNEKRKLTF